MIYNFHLILPPNNVRLDINTVAEKGSTRASLVVQMIKNLCAIQETQVQPLSWEYPLEKGMATYSSILAWRIP